MSYEKHPSPGSSEFEKHGKFLAGLSHAKLLAIQKELAGQKTDLPEPIALKIRSLGPENRLGFLKVLKREIESRLKKSKTVDGIQVKPGKSYRIDIG
ncbi:MAG: hypothetical protein ABIB04_02905 [Patescibacteria group bacterium]